MEMTTRRSTPYRRAMAILLLALPTVPAWACTTTKGGEGYTSVSVDIPIEKVDAPYGEMLSGWKSIFTLADLYFVDGCDRNARIPFRSRMTTSLKPYGTVVIGSEQYTAYESTYTPGSPLLIFQNATTSRTGGAGGHNQPVWDLNNMYNPGFNPPPSGAEGRASLFYVAVVGRGMPMAQLGPVSLGEFTSWPEAHPTLLIRSGLTMAVYVPRATCTLANQTVNLPDVPAAELARETSYARETPFNVSMNCNGNDTLPMRFTLKDAIEPANTSTEMALTPGATAKGVRMQLAYGNHSLLSMGASWMNDVKKGASTIPFIARYYRIPGEFQAGTVGGKATLTLTYF